MVTLVDNNGIEYLEDIARACPELRELGVAIDWVAIGHARFPPDIGLNRNHRIFDCIKEMRHLHTLNIRNMPEVTTGTALRYEERHHFWAADFTEKVTKGSDSQHLPIKVIALGSLTWSDVWLGSEYHRGKEVLNFLQLRVYRINYRHSPEGKRMPTLDLVAKGSLRNIDDSCSSCRILEPCWLG